MFRADLEFACHELQKKLSILQFTQLTEEKEASIAIQDVINGFLSATIKKLGPRSERGEDGVQDVRKIALFRDWHYQLVDTLRQFSFGGKKDILSILQKSDKKDRDSNANLIQKFCSLYLFSFTTALFIKTKVKTSNFLIDKDYHFYYAHQELQSSINTCINYLNNLLQKEKHPRKKMFSYHERWILKSRADIAAWNSLEHPDKYKALAENILSLAVDAKAQLTAFFSAHHTSDNLADIPDLREKPNARAFYSRKEYWDKNLVKIESKSPETEKTKQAAAAPTAEKFISQQPTAIDSTPPVIAITQEVKAEDQPIAAKKPKKRRRNEATTLKIPGAPDAFNKLIGLIMAHEKQSTLPPLAIEKINSLLTTNDLLPYHISGQTIAKMGLPDNVVDFTPLAYVAKNSKNVELIKVLLHHRGTLSQDKVLKGSLLFSYCTAVMIAAIHGNYVFLEQALTKEPALVNTKIKLGTYAGLTLLELATDIQHSIPEEDYKKTIVCIKKYADQLQKLPTKEESKETQTSSSSSSSTRFLLSSLSSSVASTKVDASEEKSNPERKRIIAALSHAQYDASDLVIILTDKTTSHEVFLEPTTSSDFTHILQRKKWPGIDILTFAFLCKNISTETYGILLANLNPDILKKSFYTVTKNGEYAGKSIASLVNEGSIMPEKSELVKNYLTKDSTDSTKIQRGKKRRLDYSAPGVDDSVKLRKSYMP